MNAFTQAWNFLKADPEMQIQGRGTAPPPIRGMMGRRRKLFTPEQMMTPQPLDAQGRPHTHPEYMDRHTGFNPTPEWLTHQREEPLGEERSNRPMTDVSRPVEPFREHLETGPEESFLTPSERFQADPSLAANLRRNVGGQQRGEFMGPLRHKLDTQQGIARGMRVKPHVRQFEEKEPEQTEDQKLDEMLAEMAAMTGGQVTHTPADLPDPEPKEKPDVRGGVGAVARRAEMDERMRAASEKPNLDLGGLGRTALPAGATDYEGALNPRYEQAMAGGDMEEMDFGDDQPMMGQQGLRERLFQIANEKARAKFRAPKTVAPEVPSEIQAMQSEIDRRL